MWFDTGGTGGEEPPAEVKRFVELINQSIIASPEGRRNAIDAYRQVMYDNVFIVTTTERVKYPLVVSKKLGNVPHAGFAITANFAAEQMFFKE